MRQCECFIPFPVRKGTKSHYKCHQRAVPKPFLNTLLTLLLFCSIISIVIARPSFWPRGDCYLRL